MGYEGDILAGSSLNFKFTTCRPSTGAPFTLAGSPVLSVYKNNGTTENTSSVTLSVDFDARTGMHNVNIDTTVDGSFFAAGNDFQVVITTGTVDSVSAVGIVVGEFSIENRCQKADVRKWIGTAVSTPTVAGVPNMNAKTWNDLTTVELPLVPATAGRKLVVDAAGIGDANMVKVGPTGAGTAQTAADLGPMGIAYAPIRRGTAQAGGSNTITLDASASSTTDFYKRCLIYITSGTGAGDRGLCTGYVGATKVATINHAWNVTPDNTSVFAVIPMDGIYDVVLAATTTTLTNAPSDSSGVTSLLARLTSARAGYLDNINNSNLSSVPAFPSNFAALGINASGHISRVVLVDTVTTVTNQLTSAQIATGVFAATLPAGNPGEFGNTVTVGAAFAALAATDTATLTSRLSATRAVYLDNLSAGAVATASALATLAGKFTGITLLAKWLGLLAGKTADASTLAEMQATTAGAGYTNVTDSLEANRDNIGTAGAGLTSVSGGGGTTVVLAPLQITLTSGQVQNLNLVAHQYAALSSYAFTVVDSTGAAINLSGKIVKLVAYDKTPTPAAALFSITGTVGGASSNVVTIAGDATNTQTARKVHYYLWNTTDNAIYAEGTLDIKPSPTGVI